MNFKDYIKDGKLVLPEGFNKPLYCSRNKLTKLILPQGFNSQLNCIFNKLEELILPEGFNSYNLFCDETVKVYEWNEWLALERDRKLKLILDEL